MKNILHIFRTHFYFILCKAIYQYYDCIENWFFIFIILSWFLLRFWSDTERQREEKERKKTDDDDDVVDDIQCEIQCWFNFKHICADTVFGDDTIILIEMDEWGKKKKSRQKNDNWDDIDSCMYFFGVIFTAHFFLSVIMWKIW